MAAANAGVLGLLSTSGIFNKEEEPLVFKAFVESGEASMDDDMAGVLETVLKRTYRLVKDKGGVFDVPDCFGQGFAVVAVFDGRYSPGSDCPGYCR